MKEFVLTKNREFSFGDCQNCEAKCCNGNFGTLFSQIILEEFEKVYENFPILFLFGELGFIKPVVLLTNGHDFCPYLKEFKCTIYEKRPTVCRTYPLSPNLDNEIYIDINCPEVNKEGSILIKDNSIQKEFSNEVFLNYQDKYMDTHFEFEKLNKDDFEEVIEIKGIKFFKYIGKDESTYISMHKKSLNTLKNMIK